MTDTPTPAKKILIVEDDQYIRELYVEILEEEGFYVEHAEDGETGYQKIFHGGYDLVLLDIMLPKMDGLTILAKINGETPPINRNRVIIVLSNLGQEATISKAMTLGAKGYLIKSDFTPAQVINKVKEYLAVV
jgi:DNA-binding response OmpR family regulator